mmetsp:Transcript_4430/g.5349  ORF Transcript_4430/g.5349 Transcript_4430/m.5349 type:complete len:88 (+) Transcript_4430:895-1158(+)
MNIVSLSHARYQKCMTNKRLKRGILSSDEDSDSNFCVSPYAHSRKVQITSFRDIRNMHKQRKLQRGFSPSSEGLTDRWQRNLTQEET